MSETDFPVSQLVNTITLEQIHTVFFFKGIEVYLGLFGPFQRKYTEIRSLVSTGPSIWFDLLPFLTLGVKYFQVELVP